MALTGLQIQKLLPKTNCKECGSNTCLAFAMKLAAKKADLSECPYASDEAKQVLGAASEPPIKGVALGAKSEVKLGEETVLYRHEKTFVNQTALAVNINDTDTPAAIDAALASIKDYVLTRVGQELRIDMVALTQKGTDAAAFAALAGTAWQAAGKPLILRGSDAKALAAAAAAVKGSRSLICAPTAESAPELAVVAKDNGHALAITAADLDSLAVLAGSLKQGGFNDLVLQFQTHSLAEQFQTNTIARRAALQDAFKATGYPSLRFIEGDDMLEGVVEAVTEINKYGGICVLPVFDAALVSSLMTLRLNIYTDPQKPIQVEPKVYAIGRAHARLTGLRDHQFLSHLLHRLRRDRELRHQCLVAGPRVRRTQRPDRLGSRQVLRRDHRQVRQGDRAGEAGDQPPDHHPRLRRADQRRARGEHARLEGPGRPPGGWRPGELHQGPAGGLMTRS